MGGSVQEHKNKLGGILPRWAPTRAGEGTRPTEKGQRKGASQRGRKGSRGSGQPQAAGSRDGAPHLARDQWEGRVGATAELSGRTASPRGRGADKAAGQVGSADKGGEGPVCTGTVLGAGGPPGAGGHVSTLCTAHAALASWQVNEIKRALTTSRNKDEGAGSQCSGAWRRPLLTEGAGEEEDVPQARLADRCADVSLGLAILQGGLGHPLPSLNTAPTSLSSPPSAGPRSWQARGLAQHPRPPPVAPPSVWSTSVLLSL